MQPRAQAILAFAMLALSAFYAYSFPCWWKYALAGFLLGISDGLLWQASFMRAPSEISHITTLREFQKLLHSTRIGRVHSFFRWAIVVFIAIIAATLSSQFTLRGFIIGCGISAATSAIIQIVVVRKYANIA